MTLKAVSSSIKQEFIHCFYCKRKYAWLNLYQGRADGIYVAKCRNCRLGILKEERKNGQN